MIGFATAQAPALDWTTLAPLCTILHCAVSIYWFGFLFIWQRYFVFWVPQSQLSGSCVAASTRAADDMQPYTYLHGERTVCASGHCLQLRSVLMCVAAARFVKNVWKEKEKKKINPICSLVSKTYWVHPNSACPSCYLYVGSASTAAAAVAPAHSLYPRGDNISHTFFIFHIR